jgi:hypothetical protein
MDKRIRLVGAAIGSCVLVGCLLTAIGGCSSGLASSQKVDKELSALGKDRLAVFPFAGKVLIDSLPPQTEGAESRIVLVLFDRAKPELPVTRRPQTACKPNGEFAFTTYIPKDGVETAEYVVTIAQLSKEKGRSFSGPDGFQNLYNDPDANDKVAEFTVKHADPGKSNYIFDLKKAGREPVATPGPRAVTQILFERPL